MDISCPYCGHELEYLGYDMEYSDVKWWCPDCRIIDTEEGWGLVGAFDDDDYPPDGVLGTDRFDLVE